MHRFKMLKESFIVFCCLMTLISCKGNNQKGTEQLTSSPNAEEKGASGDTLFYKEKQASVSEDQVLLILLHGMGSNEDDLLGMASFFPANYYVVSARAPFTLQTGSYQWYQSTSTPTQFDGQSADLKKSREMILNLVLSTQKKLGIQANHTIISGFSQGAVMSYEMAIAYPDLMAGIGAFSGTVLHSTQQKSPKQGHNIPAIFIGHGEADNRIPLWAAEASDDWLKTMGFDPEYHTYAGLPHSIAREEISDFIQFIHSTIEK